MSCAGAFIGGLLACGHDSDAIDAYCYEEWVRHNPMNDYTLPRIALIKGRKARTMLERVYGDVRIEELDRTFGPLEALVSIPKSHVEGAEEIEGRCMF